MQYFLIALFATLFRKIFSKKFDNFSREGLTKTAMLKVVKFFVRFLETNEKIDKPEGTPFNISFMETGVCMSIQIRPLTVEEIRDFLSWEYVEPYDMYNMSSTNEEEDVAFFLDRKNNYFAITNEDGEMIGFCNFGADARVQGGDYEEACLDVGMGMRPNLTGLGQGHLYAEAVFNFAAAQFPQQKLRVTIAKFNRRAQRLCARYGFSVQSEFHRAGDGRPFLILTRSC